jgi:hypothetical protein
MSNDQNPGYPRTIEACLVLSLEMFFQTSIIRVSYLSMIGTTTRVQKPPSVFQDLGL